MSVIIPDLEIILEALNTQTVERGLATIAVHATGGETIGSLLTPRTPERIERHRCELGCTL